MNDRDCDIILAAVYIQKMVEDTGKSVEECGKQFMSWVKENNMEEIEKIAKTIPDWWLIQAAKEYDERLGTVEI
jgi:dissimilatory sulfite reductase (desulfoviridin) alpha/beta subunit